MGGEEDKEKLLLGITYKKTLPCVPESQVPVMTWKSFAPICPQPPIARQTPTKSRRALTERDPLFNITCYLKF